MPELIHPSWGSSTYTVYRTKVETSAIERDLCVFGPIRVGTTYLTAVSIRWTVVTIFVSSAWLKPSRVRARAVTIPNRLALARITQAMYFEL